MSFIRNENDMYMMPAHFGPCGGPRRRPDGRRWINDNPIQTTSYSAVAVLDDPEQMENYLPEGMTLTRPYMSVGVDFLTDIAWLGNKQYALIKVTFPVKLISAEGPLNGLFLGAIWENHVDPILTGREQLGFCKIWCEIDQPIQHDSEILLNASEYGNTFLRLKIDQSKEPQNTQKFDAYFQGAGAGIFHYKYYPTAKAPYTKPDVHCICMTPYNFSFPPDYDEMKPTEPEIMRSFGEFEFNALSWEQSPCHYNIIKALSEIKIKEFVGGLYSKSESYSDIYHQRIVKTYI